MLVNIAFPAFVSPAGVSELLWHMSALEEVAGAVPVVRLC
jgi:hypothetical protein